jgi:hypothetical protein
MLHLAQFHNRQEKWPVIEFELSRLEMINLLSAQAEIEAAPDYAAVVRVLYRVEQAERSLRLLTVEIAPEGG